MSNLFANYYDKVQKIEIFISAINPSVPNYVYEVADIGIKWKINNGILKLKLQNACIGIQLFSNNSNEWEGFISFSLFLSKGSPFYYTVKIICITDKMGVYLSHSEF